MMPSGAPATFSGTPLGGWYLLAQGIAIAAWWLYLALNPSAMPVFVPPGASEIELLAFRLPDLLVAAPVSIAAGIALLRTLTVGVPLAWLASGAVVYAFVYCVAWAMLRQGGWLNVAFMAPAALLSTVSALDASATFITIFRRAAPAPPHRHVVVTLLQIAAFWSFFLVVVPTLLVYVERQLALPLDFAPAPLAAALLFAGFSSIGFWSGMTMASRGLGTPLPFDGPNRLVTGGPYACVRNPMVIAGLGQGAAVGLWFGSWTVLGYVLLGGLIWNFLVRPAEERDLRTTFGGEFDRYCREVPCWRPRLRQ